jgi:hypothetical protein
MDAGLAAGFAATVASLLAIALLVFVSRRIIEKKYRENLAARRESMSGSEGKGNRGDPS